MNSCGPRLKIERIDETLRQLRGLDPVMDADLNDTGLAFAEVATDDNVEHLDARLPLCQPNSDVMPGQIGGGIVVGRKHQAVEIAAEGRPHHALSMLRAEDDAD